MNQKTEHSRQSAGTKIFHTMFETNSQNEMELIQERKSKINRRQSRKTKSKPKRAERKLKFTLRQVSCEQSQLLVLSWFLLAREDCKREQMQCAFDF